MGKAGGWHAPLCSATCLPLSQSAGQAGSTVRAPPCRPICQPGRSTPLSLCAHHPDGREEARPQSVLCPVLSQGHGARISIATRLGPGRYPAISECVSWVHRAAARALGPSEFRNSVFQILGRTVWCCIWCVYGDTLTGFWAASQNQTHHISTEKGEIFLKTIISLTSIQVTFLPQN